MGSFNQVCLLTRAPITFGDAVVVWEEIKGPWFTNGNSADNHGLLFGLPQRASYDDYGGADKYVDKKLFDLHSQAWSQQQLYRSHQIKGALGTKILYIAASSETMQAGHEIAALFYSQEEINPLDIFEDGYEDVFREKKNRADARAKNALSAIGERIGKACLPATEAACKAECFNIVQDEVGPQLAWPVWEIISKGELFAQRNLCMMRAEAYDYLVNTVNRDIVSKYQVRNSKMEYRTWLSQHWDAWQEKRNSVTSKNPLIVQIQLRDERLMPMARPWGIEEKPIESFFWNAVGYDELMTVVGKDAFLDAMVFTTGWRYLRSNLRAESGNGQHADWKLHADMMNSVHSKVAKGRVLKRDWEPYI